MIDRNNIFKHHPSFKIISYLILNECTSELYEVFVHGFPLIPHHHHLENVFGSWLSELARGEVIGRLLRSSGMSHHRPTCYPPSQSTPLYIYITISPPYLFLQIDEGREVLPSQNVTKGTFCTKTPS